MKREQKKPACTPVVRQPATQLIKSSPQLMRERNKNAVQEDVVHEGNVHVMMQKMVDWALGGNKVIIGVERPMKKGAVLLSHAGASATIVRKSNRAEYLKYAPQHMHTGQVPGFDRYYEVRIDVSLVDAEIARSEALVRKLLSVGVDMDV